MPRFHQPPVRGWAFSFFAHPFLQRKPSCPCGGGCPRCNAPISLQPKLKINEPNDQYEQEANRVAEQVMRMSDHEVAGVLPAPMKVQRKCAACAGGHELCPECEKEEEASLQRASIDTTAVDSAPPIVHEVLRSPGQPLDVSTRFFMESRFGWDFSDVRVHTDAKAAESARAVNALAYTVGEGVVFAAGKYSSKSRSGQSLLAHELTHVIQQSHGLSGNRSIVQRLGDPSQVPAGMPCPVAVDSPLGAILDVLFGIESSGLSALEKTKIDGFVASWRALGGNMDVRIDGFASMDGPQSLNWRLSCDRALAVKAELVSPSSGRVPGIPPSFITFFAQGETNEFSSLLAPNRRATISTSTPPPPCTPPPCPSPPPGHQLRNPGIPSRALCRGACGADCDSDACVARPSLILCLSSPSGQCHRTCTYAVLECGSHSACRIHDACYDACAAAGEMDLCHQGGGCHCACDADCIRAHGAINCGLWATGRGPQPDRLRFADLPTDSGVISGACPP